MSKPKKDVWFYKNPWLLWWLFQPKEDLPNGVHFELYPLGIHVIQGMFNMFTVEY